MSKLYLQLGRLGDIISILPLLHADFESTGIKSQLMVAKEFSKVLDGCTYLDPIIFDGDYLDLERAVKHARQLSDNVIVTSIHGTTQALEKHTYSQVHSKGAVTTSFQLEQWNLAGRAREFYENLPLVFDRRDPEREKRLLDANGFTAKAKKPVLLLAVKGGVTAPFPYAGLLRELVHLKFGKQYRILDLPMVEKPDGRVYDLLAVMERAALMISIDSMPLHLAWAVRSLPVFALTNDRSPDGKPSLWHGAPWRPNHLWYCRYHDWPERAMEMCEAIDAINVEHEDDGVVRVCRAGRVKWFDFHHLSIKPGMCSRELHGAPFLKDAIRMGLQRALDDQAIEVTRDDVSDHHCILGPAYAYRMAKGSYSPIADLFSAPKSFWRQILKEIPDLALDNDDPWWAEALVAIFKRHGAKDQTGCCEFVGGEK